MCMLLQVRAIDNGSPPRYTDHSLTINILDINDNAPVIESQRGYNVSISEVGTRSHNRLHNSIHLFITVQCLFHLNEASVMMLIVECWRRHFRPARDSDRQRHRPQRHAVLLHHRWKPRPDLPHGPGDRRDGDEAGASRPRAPAGVSTHCHCRR